MIPVFPTHAGTNPIIFSQQLQVGDHFSWRLNQTLTYVGDDNLTTTFLYRFDAEIMAKIGGVELTPITFFSKYLDFTLNGSSLSNFDNYFRDKIYEYGHPYISPVTFGNKTSYIKSLHKFPWTNKTDIGLSYDLTNATIDVINQKVITGSFMGINFYDLYNYTATYDISSGVLLYYHSAINHLNSTDSDGHYSTIELLSGPDYIGQVPTSTSDTNSSVYPNTYLSIIIILPVVRLLQKRYHHHLY